MIIIDTKLLFVLLFVAIAKTQPPSPDAVVRIVPSGPDHLVNGHLTIKQCEDGILVQGTVEGLTPGFHGFHVHQNGELGNGCIEAGGHFNPYGTNHGHPRSSERHVGDLGNIWADKNGVAKIDLFDGLASLDYAIAGYIGRRAIVIHAGPDDLGRGQNQESLKTGNAGARVACGIIDDRSQPHGKFPLQVIAEPPTYCKPKLASSTIITGNSLYAVDGHLSLTGVNGGVLIQGFIDGLTPGAHGFHIHAKGDLGNACSNAGGHFNPFSNTHGHPEDVNRHVGDLGNIVADSKGTASIHIKDQHVSLDRNSPAYIGGLAFVVHALPDDLGRGRNAESLKTGNAGGRVGCGLIAVEEEVQTSGSPLDPGSVGVLNVQWGTDSNQHTGGQTLEQPIVHHNPATEHHNYNPSLSDFNGATSASVNFVPAANGLVTGYLLVAERGFGVFIEGTISGLSPGLHGFHVHENGRTGNDCRDAGGHFNPFKNEHGHPNSLNRHVGDLGNINADPEGIARIAIYDPHASLNPKSQAYIGNRAFVVHAKRDDLGQGGTAESLKTGNAGSRLACGIIQTQSGIVQAPFSIGVGSVPFPASLNEDIRPSIADVEIIPGSFPGVGGFLTVKESDSEGIFIEGTITGLTPGYHGFHVHQKGYLTNRCVDAGGHFNPFNKKHGEPKAFERHVGDLGNIFAENDGTARIGIYDSHASLNPYLENYIGGRAFVVHEGQDDLGQGGNAESLKTGNAGSRVGCGLIRVRTKEAHQSLAFPSDFHHFSSGTIFQSSKAPDAICKITPAGPNDQVSGNLELRNHNLGVAITGQITGLTPGKHGFHVHQSGDLGNACVNAGGHFNPFQQSHGDPHSFNRHVGDLGNIVADKSGRAIIHIFDDHISLNPNQIAYIGGRSFMVHDKEDDLGRGDNEESLKTGNAGRRVGCGVIKLYPQTLQQQNTPIQFPLI